MAVRKLDEHVAWRRGDMLDAATWTVNLTEADHRELHDALQHAKSVSSDVLELGRDDFPLSSLKQKLDEIDHVVSASDGDAIIMAQKLASELGLAVGISSGANLIGALSVQDQLGSKSIVATIFCDDNKKYLSTDLAREEPVKPGYIAPEVELIGFETIPYAAADASIIA